MLTFYGLVIAISLYNLSDFLILHFSVIVSPSIDKMRFKVKRLKQIYLGIYLLLFTLYPIFYFINTFKIISLILFYILIIFSAYLKSIMLKLISVLMKALMEDYEAGVYKVQKMKLIALSIAHIVGPLLLFLPLVTNITSIIIFATISLLALLTIKEVNVNANADVISNNYFTLVRKGIKTAFSNDILRNYLFYEIASSLPIYLFNIFFIYFIF